MAVNSFLLCGSRHLHDPTTHSMSDKTLAKHVDIFAHMWPARLFSRKTKIHHDNINVDSAVPILIHINLTYHMKSLIPHHIILSSHSKTYDFTSCHFIFNFIHNISQQHHIAFMFIPCQKRNSAPFECPWLLGAP